MNLMLAGLTAGLVGNASAVAALWLRLRWKTLQQNGHRMHMAELARTLPEHSHVDSHDGPGGLHTTLTVGRARGQR